ncbi:hypothetical protein SALBM311S_04032 [Streptomyces alboniger]
MPGENLSRDEARERAALLSVDGYDVSLDIRTAVGDETGDGPRTFRSVTTIRFRCDDPGSSSFADLIAPEVTAVSLNGKDLDPSEVFDGSRILLEDLASDNELIVDAQCAYSRTGEGLHRFVDPEDGEVYLYTQYEPADSRRVFANFEQPDLKAPFRFEVRAPEGWTVWGNGVGELAAGVWRFAETKPISTYITCVVAGPYHYVTDSYERVFEDGTRLEIPLGALCRKGLAPHFDSDDVFLVTKQGLDFFHDHFDYPYPFGKYDQAFVPEYNLGAMENPGLVTFREEYIFRGKVTQASYEGRANVILHEMAHMWFGDLVTMEWWDDLWLKESFADFMGEFSLVGATRFVNGWVTFANRRKAWAYRADQLPSTHPITADIRDLQDAKLNFDGITYARRVGAEAARGVRRAGRVPGGRPALLQAERVRRTRLGDLLSVLEETSGRDMGAWARAWLQTAALNSLTPQVLLDAEGRIDELAVVQEAAESHPDSPHRVAGACTGGPRQALERTPVPRWTSTARVRSCPSWPAPRPPSWCWSTTTTSPTARILLRPGRVLAGAGGRGRARHPRGPPARPRGPPAGRRPGPSAGRERRPVVRIRPQARAPGAAGHHRRPHHPEGSSGTRWSSRRRWSVRPSWRPGTGIPPRMSWCCPVSAGPGRDQEGSGRAHGITRSGGPFRMSRSL